MNESHDWAFWILVGVFVMLIAALLVYLIGYSRRSWLGGQWIDAAGSFENALNELERYEARTEDMLRRSETELSLMDRRLRDGFE